MKNYEIQQTSKSYEYYSKPKRDTSKQEAKIETRLRRVTIGKRATKENVPSPVRSYTVPSIHIPYEQHLPHFLAFPPS